jgi:hypothetical protein
MINQNLKLRHRCLLPRLFSDASNCGDMKHQMRDVEVESNARSKLCKDTSKF